MVMFFSLPGTGQRLHGTQPVRVRMRARTGRHGDARVGAQTRT